MPDKLFLATYIIRIYRLKQNNPRSLVGIVEEVGRKGKKAFTHYDELWEILSSFGSHSYKRTSSEKLKTRKADCRGGRLIEKKGGDPRLVRLRR